jgi:hypothetical protein
MSHSEPTYRRLAAPCLLTAALMFGLMLLAGCARSDNPTMWTNVHDPENANFIPEAPSILSLDQRSDRLIMLRIVRNSRYDTGFVIYRKEGEGPFLRLGALRPDSSSFADTAVIDVSKRYVYKVATYSARGVESVSFEATLLPVFTPPLLEAVRDTNRTSVRLRWENRSTYGDGFIVERMRSGSQYEPIAVLPFSASMFVDAKAETTAVHAYRICAYTRHNTSEPSNVAFAEFVPEFVFSQWLSVDGINRPSTRLVVARDRSVSAILEGNEGAIYIFSNADMHLLRRLPIPDERVLSADISPDGRFCAASYIGGGASTAGTIRIWQLNDGTVYKKWERPGGVDFVRFSSDGLLLAADAASRGSDGYATASTQLINIETGTAVATMDGRYCAAFSPDQSFIALGADWNDVPIRVRAVIDGALKASFIDHEGYSKALKFFRDGRRLASASTGRLSVWDVVGQKTLLNVPGVWNGVDVMGSDDFVAALYGAVRIWRTGDWKQIAAFLDGSDANIYDVGFLGRERLLVASSAGTRLYTLRYRWMNAGN